MNARASQFTGLPTPFMCMYPKLNIATSSPAAAAAWKFLQAFSGFCSTPCPTQLPVTHLALVLWDPPHRQILVQINLPQHHRGGKPAEQGNARYS